MLICYDSILVAEGIMTLHDPAMRALYDLKANAVFLSKNLRCLRLILHRFL